MSFVPYWLRHLRKLAYRGPVVRALEESFFRDRLRYMRQATAPLEHEASIERVYSDSELKVDGKTMEVHLDVQNFTPEQIQVKTVGNEVTVEGKRDVRREGGWTRSHFERRFLLPGDFPPERVECHLDRGQLRLVAFRAEPLPERTVPVQDNGGRKDGRRTANNKASNKASSDIDDRLDMFLIVMLLIIYCS